MIDQNNIFTTCLKFEVRGNGLMVISEALKKMCYQTHTKCDKTGVPKYYQFQRVTCYFMFMKYFYMWLS